MKTTLRAVLSIVLLIGFYVLALGLVATLGMLGFGRGSYLDIGGTTAARALILGSAFMLLFTLVYILGWVLLVRPSPPAGVRLTPEQAPELWRIVRDLAARVAAREPDEVRLVAGASAAVTDDARLLGLIPGRRRVILGLPLLQAYTVDQLQAVLAHEMGHFSRRHTTTMLLAHGGRTMVVETARHINLFLLRGLLTGYARLHVAVEQAVSWQMEYQADRYAVAVAGRDTMVSALREIRVVATGWDEYLEHHVNPAYDRGHLPEDLFGGFAAYLAECREEIRERSVEVATTESAWWESHPPIGERIAALRFVPDVPVILDGRPATVLLPDLDATSGELQAALFERTDIGLLPWDRLAPILAHQFARDLADPLHRAAARLTGRADADLDQLLDLFAADRYADLARELGPGTDAEEGLKALTAAFEGAVEAAAVDSGAAAWRLSWTGPPELLTADGEPLPLGELVDLAADPATVPAARERLAALGIRVAAASASPAPA
ncbi:M48 family metallopeptidase [Micromonospora sp. RTP1Z1]|uniref:M48 family metallopeptidase n=1 Tax=Micromonospora sp. RTP1Z1 TaxID=2994043 RepID=UPI0029C8B250|nr:M48 family metallopeptidase [Micromonospora sp. RTP1Z1]